MCRTIIRISCVVCSQTMASIKRLITVHVFSFHHLENFSVLTKSYFFKAKAVSEEGFEPSPPIGDQNTHVTRKDSHLESGALDHSAILTITNP